MGENKRKAKISWHGNLEKKRKSAEKRNSHTPDIYSVTEQICKGNRPDKDDVWVHFLTNVWVHFYPLNKIDLSVALVATSNIL